ncbi:hypothetical protein P355_0282 [Burkholderia cenocepacia KC-01]|nr:hypothetical protein P355_0282 [Burkholderia cenocepacia KC-01]
MLLFSVGRDAGAARAAAIVRYFHACGGVAIPPGASHFIDCHNVACATVTTTDDV